MFVALRDHLPEDYLVYYDIAVDGRRPDFIIVGPDLGRARRGSRDGVRHESIVPRKRAQAAGGRLLVDNPRPGPRY